jgi:hypothetical protein
MATPFDVQKKIQENPAWKQEGEHVGSMSHAILDRISTKRLAKDIPEMGLRSSPNP